MPITAAALAPYAGYVLPEAALPGLPNRYRGKVRENYDLPDGRRVIIATDRLSAFDIILTTIPLKGQVLTQLARWWFERTADLCPNHVLSYPDPNVLVAQRLDILPVEIVVRDYLAGSTSTAILTMYKAGRREMYGHRLPDGLRANQKLPQTLITPTSKEATKAPITLPIPPITTTTKASIITCTCSPGPTESAGAANAPPKPDKAAPRAKTLV
jgi:phosphoribosylaminoimidazole-succinocarboxamide synthase